MAEELETKVENTEETHDSNNEGRQWYVVNTYSGHENKVKENLEKRVESMGLQNILFNIVIPEHVETEIKNGKKVNKTVNMFPGYVLVEMIMTIATTDTSGITSDTLSTCSPARLRRKTPRRTGTRITFTTESTIAQKETSTQAPARTYTRNGVISGAASVETMVIPTESATSPPAI